MCQFLVISSLTLCPAPHEHRQRLSNHFSQYAEWMQITCWAKLHSMCVQWIAVLQSRSSFSSLFYFTGICSILCVLEMEMSVSPLDSIWIPITFCGPEMIKHIIFCWLLTLPPSTTMMKTFFYTMMLTMMICSLEWNASITIEKVTFNLGTVTHVYAFMNLNLFWLKYKKTYSTSWKVPMFNTYTMYN